MPPNPVRLTLLQGIKAQAKTDSRKTKKKNDTEKRWSSSSHRQRPQKKPDRPLGLALLEQRDRSFPLQKPDSQ